MPDLYALADPYDIALAVLFLLLVVIGAALLRRRRNGESVDHLPTPAADDWQIGSLEWVDVAEDDWQIDSAAGKVRPLPPASSGAKRTGTADFLLCPKCGSPMILRRTVRGPRAGQDFWGCRRYPECQTILPVLNH